MDYLSFVELLYEFWLEAVEPVLGGLVLLVETVSISYPSSILRELRMLLPVWVTETAPDDRSVIKWLGLRKPLAGRSKLRNDS